jgi:hypothetical protein
MPRLAPDDRQAAPLRSCAWFALHCQCSSNNFLSKFMWPIVQETLSVSCILSCNQRIVPDLDITTPYPISPTRSLAISGNTSFCIVPKNPSTYIPQNRQHASAFALMYIFLLRSCKLTSLLSFTLASLVVKRLLLAGCLCSASVTSFHYSYAPIRHSLLFDALPALRL